MNRTVRDKVDNASDVFWYVTAPISVAVAVGVAAALNVTIRSLPPVPVPPAAIVPTAVPPTDTTLPTAVPLLKLTVPVVLIPSRSSANTLLPLILTVNAPPLNVAESGSLTDTSGP